MRPRRLLSAGLVCLAAFGAAPSASAQTHLRVSPLDPVYDDLEKLRGFGLLPEQIVAHKPYSEAEIVRFVDAARARLGPETPGLAVHILDRLAARFMRPARPAPRLGHARLDLVTSNADWRGMPPSNLGGLDAELNPLLQPAGGRRLSDGSDALAELSFDWAPAERIAFSVTPRVQISRPDEGEDAEDVFLQNLQANLALGNLILSVGRDYVAWAQGVHGGLAFGGNARGLDRVELRTDRPFAFPGFLGFLGSGAASLFVSRLEEDRDIPHSYLVGYRLGLRPGRAFEFGMMALVHSGGEGAPESSLGDRVLENIIFLEPFIDAQASNRQLGFDIRIRFPGERGAELYSEYLLEDPPANLSVYKKWLWHDVGWLVGLWFPRLDEAGRTDLRLEGRHTGLRLGRHTQFTSGMSLDGQLLGDGLGPDGNGAYLTLGTLLGSDLRLELHGAAERRSRDRYRFGPPPGGGPNRFERIESFAKEDRARVLATLWYRPVDRPISLRVRGGFEWADDFAFVAGDRRRAFSLWVTGFWRP